VSANFPFGRVRRRARRFAGLDHGATLLPALLAVSAVLACLSGRCRGRRSRNDRYRTGPDTHGGAALIMDITGDPITRRRPIMRRHITAGPR